MSKHKAIVAPPCIIRCRGPNTPHMVAVVCAAIKVYLVQHHCDVSVGLPNYHPRLPTVLQKNERRSVDSTMRWPVGPTSEIQSFFPVTTAVGTWRRRNQHHVATLDNPTDRALFPLGTQPHTAKRTEIGNHSYRSMPPKRTV